MLMNRLFLFFLLITVSLTAQNNFYLAENYYRQGEYKKAITIYKELANKNPYNSIYVKRLVACYQETEAYTEAQSFLQNLITKKPAAKYIYVEIGYNHSKQGHNKLAEQSYKKALESISKNPSLGRLIATSFKDHGLLDRALLAYQNTMKYNKNANYNFQVAQIFGEKGEYKKMFESYISLVDKNDSYLNTILKHTGKYITNDPENPINNAFKKTLLKSSTNNPKDVWNIMLSWLFVNQQEYFKAYIQEKALLARNPEFIDRVFTLGKTAFENKDYKTAKLIFKLCLDNTFHLPLKIETELYLTKIQVKLNPEDAEKHFTKIFEVYGNKLETIKVQEAYADYLTFVKQNPTQAKEILEKAIALHPNKFTLASLKLKLADILVFTNQFGKALITYTQVQTKFKNHPLGHDARYKVAKTSYYKGDFKWAKIQVKVLKSSTSQMIANDALELFLLLSENMSKDSINTSLEQFAKADLLSYQKKNKEAIALLNNTLASCKNEPLEDDVLYKLAQLYKEEKHYGLAVQSLQKIEPLNPQGLFVDDALFEIADLYQNHINEPQKAKDYYQKIIFDYASSIHLVEARKRFRKLRGDNIQ